MQESAEAIVGRRRLGDGVSAWRSGVGAGRAWSNRAGGAILLRIGGALARYWAEAGHEVLMSSRHPEELQGLADELGPRARAGTPREAAGVLGRIGGQMADLQDDHATSQPAELEQLYWQKTGGLFEFSVVTGGRLRGLNDEALDALKRFAREFGLAFQIYDDLLDLDGTEEETGKNVGQDQGKPTLVSVQSAANINALLAAARDTALQQLRTAQMESTALWDLAERQFNTAAARARAVGVRSIAS